MPHIGEYGCDANNEKPFVYQHFRPGKTTELGETCMNEDRTCIKKSAKQTQARSSDVHGWTYFFENEDLIKIGFSARPRRRLAEHRRKHPNLKVLAVVPTSIAGEFETHQRFDHLRADGGEIFRPEPELYAFIEEVKALAEASTLRKTMSGLTVLRNQHKADSAIGHHCSNVMRLLQTPHPPAFQLKLQMVGLERAMREFQ